MNAGANRDAKELGKYLVRVANDEPEYRRLHQWRRTGGSDKFKALMDMQVDLTPLCVMRTMVGCDLCGTDIIGRCIGNKCHWRPVNHGSVFEPPCAQAVEHVCRACIAVADNWQAARHESPTSRTLLVREPPRAEPLWIVRAKGEKRGGGLAAIGSVLT
jgi:hypothetical protein